MSEFDEIIVAKQNLASRYCKDENQLGILQFQIRVCEELGRALTTDRIMELATMPLRRMENMISLHKFA